MNGILKDWLDAGYQTFFIGLAAFVWLIVAKLLAAQGYIPFQTLRDLISLA